MSKLDDTLNNSRDFRSDMEGHFRGFIKEMPEIKQDIKDLMLELIQAQKEASSYDEATEDVHYYLDQLSKEVGEL